MKKTIKKFGAYAFIIGIMLFFCMLYFGSRFDYGTQEFLGYATIVIALSTVFFGVKYYRDQENNGKLSFKKALSLGLFISVFVGLGIGLMDGFYVSVINPDFFQEYSEASMKVLKEAGDTQKLEEMKAQMQQFESMSPVALSLFSGGLMFITVMLVGLIISILSGLLLQKK
ncbi:DUF4199 domain-containing protein [uncultured Dokdonia sp.]|uniref:DUF4199 domain-containing protein n=1 Tax=uncultured Dokdonia sp. TaxID=575653 RepID=UPI002630BF8B|nr:DUF4199 domain-containing protein [uncultured Dokdonia sp.]